jgi:DNA-binding Lrp family transcriptional regulator
MASALRLRILRMTYHDPLTNREIARRLRRDPATTLYHVRKLVDTGLLEALPPRRGARGSREIPYRATGVSWSLDPAPDEDPRAMGEAMLEAFLGEVADIGVERVVQWRLALRLDQAQVDEFRERLNGLLQDFAERPPSPEEPLLAVYVAVHPTPG